jgi:hypothetical protein
MFGVKPVYLTDEEATASTDEQLDLLAMLRRYGLSWREVNRLPSGWQSIPLGVEPAFHHQCPSLTDRLPSVPTPQH